MKIKIGDKFIRSTGKGRKEIETVEDIYTTKNHKGEIVKVEYVASHDFMGQKVFDYEIPAATIQRAKRIKENMNISEQLGEALENTCTSDFF